MQFPVCGFVEDIKDTTAIRIGYDTVILFRVEFVAFLIIGAGISMKFINAKCFWQILGFTQVDGLEEWK